MLILEKRPLHGASRKPHSRRRYDLLLVGSEEALTKSGVAEVFAGARFRQVARSSTLTEALACLVPGTIDIVLLSHEFAEEEVQRFDAEAHLRGFRGLILRPVFSREPQALFHPDQTSPIEIGDIVVDVLSQYVIVRGVEIQCNFFECKLLSEFCRHPGELLSHEALMDAVWGKSKAQRHSLRELIHCLRAKIETETSPRYIITHHRLGYRFVPAPNATL